MPKAVQKAVPVEKLGDLDSQGLLDQIIDTGIRPPDDAGRERAKDLVQTLVSELVSPGMVVAKGVTQTINKRIAAIDEVLSRQLDQVMHSPEFQKLESSWRGLHKLVHASETGESLKIRV